MYQGLQTQGTSQITQGSTLYILNRKDFTLTQATVTGVSQPHIPKAAQGNAALALQGLVIDLFLSMGSETTSVEFPVNSISANYPDKGWFISADNLAVSREVENILNGARQFLSQVPFNEGIVKRAPALLVQLNPEKKREAQQEQEISLLKEQIAEMEKRSNESASKLDKVLALLSSNGGLRTQKQKD